MFFVVNHEILGMDVKLIFPLFDFPKPKWPTDYHFYTGIVILKYNTLFLLFVYNIEFLSCNVCLKPKI